MHSKLKSIIKDILPPMFLKARRRFCAPPTGTGLEEQTFSDFDKALQACGGGGYQAVDLVRVVGLKTEVFRRQCASVRPYYANTFEMLLLYAILLSKVKERQDVCVLDFGGACGAHYFVARNLLPLDMCLRWHVVETPRMSEAAQQFATDELMFYDTIQAAAQALPRIDLIHSSGALQYVADPCGTLNELLACGPGWIVLSRMALSGKTKEVRIQRSRLSEHGLGPLPPGTEDVEIRYPLTFVPGEEFQHVIGSQYETVLKVGGTVETTSVDNVLVSGEAWLARKRH